MCLFQTVTSCRLLLVVMGLSCTDYKLLGETGTATYIELLVAGRELVVSCLLQECIATCSLVFVADMLNNL